MSAISLMTHNEGKQIMALKIVKRSKQSAAKPAASGSARTGAKVEKVKSGRRAASPAGTNIGLRSGLSIMKYQNQTLEQNRKHRLSDEELAKDWCREFPNSRAVQNGSIDAGMVAAVRSAYNRGKHGNNDGEPVPDKARVPQYDDDGEPMPFRGEKTAAAREKKAVTTGTKKVLKKKSKK